MKKTISELIDELTIVNIKIYHLVDKVESGEFEKAEAQKLQSLNKYRSQLKNAISEWAAERVEVKI